MVTATASTMAAILAKATEGINKETGESRFFCGMRSIVGCSIYCTLLILKMLDYSKYIS